MKQGDYKPEYGPKYGRQGVKTLQGLGLLAMALYTFHGISALLFSVLGLAPSSPTWNLVLLLGGMLAVSGIAISLQTFRLPLGLRQAAGVLSGASSGAVLGFYTLGQLSGQVALWAFVGAAVGGSLLGSLALWAYGSAQVGAWRRFFGLAIAVSSSLCTYAMAFGIGTWMFAALSTTRWVLAIPLGLATGLYLWLTQRVLVWVYRQWRKI
ncbi:MAG: hypothetical protein AAFU71_14680 [Cyanobacteria bacterium J06632_22]